jgi:hypothetical protein
MSFQSMLSVIVLACGIAGADSNKCDCFAANATANAAKGRMMMRSLFVSTQVNLMFADISAIKLH